MTTSDQQLRIGVLVGGALLIIAITYVRFCGSLALPAKPPPPAAGPTTGNARQLLSTAASSPSVYQDYLQKDAATAGVKAPSIEQMSRKLAYHVDEPREGYSLEPGKPAIEKAGLRLHLERSGDAVLLVIHNLLDSDVAYNVTTTPSLGAQLCDSARPLPFNAMVIARRGSETRTECAWRDGLAIVVNKVETVEVPPLSSFYLSETPPALVGLDERLVRGHRGASGSEPCPTMVAAAVRSGVDRGDIGWRDLVDFYARHRCQSYQFPPEYRAFKSDGERALPAGE
ncbi:MAG TPA: hypothetical protein VMJ10_35625 [Kofleriaceae bacterium]|nr:hypothetical protein [Kofleriaceae bacterium]